MRFLNIKLLALIALLSIGNNVFAYTWSFSNFTSKTLVIGLGLVGAGFWNYNIVEPGDKVNFAWSIPSPWAGWCMSGAQWAEYDPNIKHALTKNGGMDMYQPGATMLPDEFRWVYVQTDYYRRSKNVEIIYLPDEVYADTVKHASGIGSGIDSFLCTAVALIKAVNKGTCPSMFAALINWIGGLIARSACANREFEILEDDKGQIVFISMLR